MKTRTLATACESAREWDFSRIAQAVGLVSRIMVRRVGDGSGIWEFSLVCFFAAGYYGRKVPFGLVS